jgi:retron-type reverse transcriptase
VVRGGWHVGEGVLAQCRRGDPEVAEEIPARRYRPRALRWVWVRKRSNEDEFRPLAIPAVRNHMAAGAAHEVLEHVFEPLCPRR